MTIAAVQEFSDAYDALDLESAVLLSQQVCNPGFKECEPLRAYLIRQLAGRIMDLRDGEPFVLEEIPYRAWKRDAIGNCLIGCVHLRRTSLNPLMNNFGETLTDLISIRAAGILKSDALRQKGQAECN